MARDVLNEHYKNMAKDDIELVDRDITLVEGQRYLVKIESNGQIRTLRFLGFGGLKGPAGKDWIGDTEEPLDSFYHDQIAWWLDLDRIQVTVMQKEVTAVDLC